MGGNYLFVTGLKYVLLRNNQHGGFIDVTAEAGLLDGDLQPRNGPQAGVGAGGRHK